VGYDTTPLMSTTISAASDLSDPDTSLLNLLTTRTAKTSTFKAASKPRFPPRGDTLDLSRQEANELLRGSAFSEWKDNAAAGDNAVESPEEMRRKDPLGTQIWKLYSKTKTRLPNQERLENLTWRMMAMNLKRRGQL
jgi:GATA-binding protein, other eukaryote